jgi:ligand-binding sensor domain-containing protein
LPTETVYDIYQDKKGFIWISTEQGLYRYDGKNYTSYTLDEQTSKSGSGITEDILEEFGIVILMAISTM